MSTFFFFKYRQEQKRAFLGAFWRNRIDAAAFTIVGMFMRSDGVYLCIKAADSVSSIQ